MNTIYRPATQEEAAVRLAAARASYAKAQAAWIETPSSGLAKRFYADAWAGLLKAQTDVARVAR